MTQETLQQPTEVPPLRAKGYAEVSWVSRLFFAYVDPILDRAAAQPLEEGDARWVTPDSDNAHALAAKFERAYEEVKAHYASPAAGSSFSRRRPRRPWTTLTGITLLRLYWWPMVLESLWVLVEVGQRLGTPVALREFLRWLQDYSAGAQPNEWGGWVWAVVLGVCGYSMVIIHHQLFWIGMRAGFNMRMQTVAAIHSKVLRLNSAAVGVLSTGHVVNLVSNDVRRFDDVMPFWIFLWAAPLELAMVLLMVSLELDFLSALAGVATSLAMIPLQSALVRYIGGLRRNTARCTDERVRLAGEVVEGALAMKMLSWEDPFAAALRSIRARETHFSRRMQRIKAVNFAMQFCITPIVSFVTFAVYRARNGTLNVASVFYSLSLLHLPKLYMINFFVLAVQSLTELRVSLQRIDAFLSTPEPPRPGHEPPPPAPGPGHGQGQHTHHGAAGATATPPAGGADPPAPRRQSLGDVIRRSLETVRGLGTPGGGGRRSRECAAGGSQGGKAGEGGPATAPPPAGYVAMRGADYDWARPFGRDDLRLKDTHGTALGGGGGGGGGNAAAATAAAKAPVRKTQGSAASPAGADVSAAEQTVVASGGSGDGDVAEGGGGGDAGLTLVGVRFAAVPGELLGICGAVGCGKSSLLAALLGELQPLKRGAGGGGGGGDTAARWQGDTAKSSARGPGAAAVNGTNGANGVNGVNGTAIRGAVADGAVNRTANGASGRGHNANGAGGGGAGAVGHVRIEVDGGEVVAEAEAAGRGDDDDDGGPVVRGRVAYCAQVPWIVAGSVRENIVFGSPWDEQWYGRVVYACCLADDLAGLPAGDATELGERGINLSGGQKARVALARACYARPAVALLDDPLSAVDPRVGRELFARAIGPGGLLAEVGATRLLVTHQRQYLPKCDRVLVLRGGRTLALGRWREVAALQLPELTAGHGGLGGGGGGDGDGGAEGAMEATVDEALDEMAAAAEATTAAEANVRQGDGTTEALVGTEGSGAGGSSSASGSEDAAIVVQAAAPPPATGIPVQMPPPSPLLPPASEALPEGGFKQPNGGAAALQEAAPQGGSGWLRPGSWRLWRIGSRREGTGAADPGLVDGGGPGGGGGGGSLASRFWRTGGGGGGGGGPGGARLGRDGSAVGRPPAAEAVAAAGDGALAAKSGSGQSMGRAMSLAERYRRSLSAVVASGRAGGPQRSRSGLQRKEAGAAGSLQTANTGKLVASEDRETGTVAWSVYGRYCRHLGLLATAVICIALVAGQAVFLASEWWLALWAREDAAEQGQAKWLWVYAMLTGIVIVVGFLRSATFFEATLSAATSIHNAMAARVLRAPLAFFHTNPSGRIVNRFSKDQGQVDDLLPSCLFDMLQSAFYVLGAFVLAAIAVPVILPVFLPLVLAFWWIRRRYITASRDIKRWEAVTRSPVFASFSATLKGLPTIRAYGAYDRFNSAFLDLMAHNGDWYFSFISTARWIGVRLDAVAGTALMATTLLAMATRDRIDTGVLALALTHVLQLVGLMQWVVRQSAEVENTMTSVERMLAYTQLDSEPPRVAEGGAAPQPGWPRSGALTYHNVTAVYRPGLPPVLRDISFRLQPGSSCGVVGRTGSGKSSLMLTLFRLIDVTGGTILLDGVDTASLGLDALRRQLAIIPQDPVLFSGTLRSNLDPWRGHSDDALWRVLEAVQLRAAVAAMPGGLDAAMSECGGNLSVGQRQLFCLARALLQDAKVLALDEATANVDRATDELIQNALRDFAHRDRELHGRVLLVIAHRIDTILDTDQLLVLSAGRLVESGPPAELAAGAGVFAGMVAAARLAGGGGAGAAKGAAQGAAAPVAK